jgi:hypothetical protein
MSTLNKREMTIRPFLFLMGFSKFFGLASLIGFALVYIVRFPAMGGRETFVVFFVLAIMSLYAGLYSDSILLSTGFLISAAIGLGMVTGQDVVLHGFTDPIRIAVVLSELVLVLWIAGVIVPEAVTTWRIFVLMAIVLLFQIAVGDFSDNLLQWFGVVPQTLTNWGLISVITLSLFATLVYQRSAKSVRTPDNAIDGGIVILAYYLLHRLARSGTAKLEVKKSYDLKPKG